MKIIELSERGEPVLYISKTDSLEMKEVEAGDKVKAKTTDGNSLTVIVRKVINESKIIGEIEKISFDSGEVDYNKNKGDEIILKNENIYEIEKL